MASNRKVSNSVATPPTPSTPSTPNRYSFRNSFHFPPTYQVSNQDSQHSQVNTSMDEIRDIGGEEVYQPQSRQPPSSFYNQVVSHSPRSHSRRPSLTNSIRNGMRSIGRKLSVSKSKARESGEQDEAESSQGALDGAVQAHLQSLDLVNSRPQTASRGFFASIPTRRPTTMPLFRADSTQSAASGSVLSPASDAPHTIRTRPSFHRQTTTERQELFAGGAGARASAALHNESLQIARATPLPPYSPRSRSSSIEDIKDSESGIGIIVHDLERTRLRGPRVAKLDPVDILAPELLEHILSFLDAATILRLELVSKKWQILANSQTVWRQVFFTKYAPSRHHKVKGAPKQAGIGKNTSGQDYRKLYQIRSLIDQRWATGSAAATYLYGHQDSVYCVQFDEDKIVTGSRDQTVRIWDARTYQCIRRLGPPRDVNEQAPLVYPEIEPRGTVPFHRMDARSVEPASQPLQVWHAASVLCLQYDDEILVTGSSDFSAIVWSIKQNYRPLFQLRGHTAGVLDVAIDAHRIITCSKDTTIKIWNRHTGVLIKTLTGHQGPVNAVQVRSNLLASASGDGCSKLWRLDTGMCIKEFHSAKRGLACVEFSEDGRSIFAGGNDRVIYEYDTATGGIRRELSGHEDLVRSLYLDSANRRLISGSYDHSIKVWDSSRGTSCTDGGLIVDLQGWTSSWMLAAKSNYRKIAAASQDGRVVIVDFGFGIPGVELVEA